MVRLYNKITNHPNRRLAYLISYTVLFAICALAAFSVYIFEEKSFVWAGANGSLDGMSQHYSALVYWGRYLRGLVSNVFSGNFSVPLYDASIGFGSDIIHTLSYYVIGDPLTLLSVFVPEAYTEYLYAFLIILRLYLAGLTFSALAFHFRKNNSFFTLAASMIYVFSSYSIYAAVRHPYFVNPMIYFPLVILGAEYIFSGRKPWLFILSIALSAVSNFYFFYMICILTVVYAAIRVFSFVPKGQSKLIFTYLLKFALSALLGILMACVLFYPGVLITLGSSRTSSVKSLSLFYDLRYYLMYAATFTSSSNSLHWCVHGHIALSLPALILMWSSPRKNRLQVIFFSTATVFLFIPVFGYILNGTAYTANRWIWAYSLLVSLICAIQLPDAVRLFSKKPRYVIVVFSVLSVLCIAGIFAVDSAILTAICLILTYVLFTFVLPKVSHRKILSRGLIIALIILQIAEFGLTRNLYLDYHSDFVTASRVYEFAKSAPSAPLAEFDDDGYYRHEEYADKSVERTRNRTLINGGSSTTAYFSLSSDLWYDMLRSLGDKNGMMQIVETLDNRTILCNLANVRYFVCESEDSSGAVPYGYSTEPVLVSEQKNLSTFCAHPGMEPGTVNYEYYKNELSLPFGYTYDSYMTREDYEKLSYTDRQRAMLYSAILETDSSSLKEFTLSETDAIEVTVSYDDTVTQIGNAYYTESEGNIYIDFSGAAPFCETYLSMENFEFFTPDPIELAKFDGSWDNAGITEKLVLTVKSQSRLGASIVHPALSMGETKKDLEIYAPKNTYYAGPLDMCINMGYHEDAPHRIVLTLNDKGAYAFDNICVRQISMNGYEEQVSALSEEHLENTEFSDNRITGTITVSDNKLMCISLPCSDGWTAYVDGVETEIIQTNIGFMGIKLSKGTHSIEFRYFTPHLSIGILLSIIGWIIFAVWFIIDRKMNKRT